MRPRLTWLVPLAACAGALVVYLVTDIDTALLSLPPVTPILFVILANACVALYLRRRGPRRASPMAAVSLAMAVVLLAALLIAGTPLKDFARFQAWSIGHRSQALSARRVAAVLSHWGAWSFAGKRIDDYLVSDPTDALAAASAPGRFAAPSDARLAAAKRWSAALRLPCDPDWVRRVERGFFVVTTYRCELQPGSGLPDRQPPAAAAAGAR